MTGLLKFYKIDTVEFLDNIYLSPKYTIINFIGKYIYAFFFDCAFFTPFSKEIQEIDRVQLNQKVLQVNRTFATSLSLFRAKNKAYSLKYSEPNLEYNKIYRLKFTLSTGIYYSDLFCINGYTGGENSFVDANKEEFLDNNNETIIE